MKALAIITALCLASGVHAGHVWGERPEDVDKEMRVRTEHFRSAPRSTAPVLHRTTGTDKFFSLDSIVSVYPETGNKIVDRYTYTATGQPSKRVIASWDPSTNTWKTMETSGYEWNEHDLCVLEWVTSYLGINSRVEYEYDSYGNPCEIRGYEYFNDIWVPRYREKYSYDEASRKTSVEHNTWDGTDWIPNSQGGKYECEFNDAGEITFQLNYRAFYVPDQRNLSL